MTTPALRALLLATILTASAAAQGHGADKEPDRGLPGDEGPLRSQAFVPLLGEDLLPALRGAGTALAEARAAEAFPVLRRLLESARAATEGGLLVAVDGGPDARVFTDLAALVRARARGLSGAARDAALAEAEPAAAVALADALPWDRLVAAAALFPGTDHAARAMRTVASRLAERGDLLGARALLQRAEESGGGGREERASAFLLERALAAQLGDAFPAAPPDDLLDVAVSVRGGRAALRDALAEMRGSEPPAPPPGAAREAWRVRMPSPGVAVPSSLEPGLRLAAEAGTSIVVQSAAELLELDGATGALRARLLLEPPSAIAGAAREPSSPLFHDEIVIGGPRVERRTGFPGRREARPATDGRFVAATFGGALLVAELPGLEPRWRRQDGTLLVSGHAPADEPARHGALFADGALVVSGRVLVASIQSPGDTTTTLECFDAATGACLFSRVLATGASVEPGAPSGRPRVLSGGVLPQPLALVGGRVVVVTELGVVFCVSPLDGEVEWAVRTQRSPLPFGYERSAPRATEGRAHVLPADSDYLYLLEPRLPAGAFDGTTSALPFAFDRAPRRRRESDARLVGASGSRALTLGWQAQKSRRVIRSFDFATRTVSDTELALGENVTGAPARLGRGFWVSTDHGLTAIEILSGDGDALLPVTLTPPPLDADGRRLPAAAVFGDLTPVDGGVLSVTETWISRWRAGG